MLPVTMLLLAWIENDLDMTRRGLVNKKGTGSLTLNKFVAVGSLLQLVL